ncbi:UNVERIFIED_CONTAM: hypothetical protein FKN15_034347 [Acipenser sinensis]
MNTHCPLKCVPSAARFFTLCRLTVQPPQSYSVGGQRSSGQLTGKPAEDTLADLTHPSRATLGQLSAAPWELPSTIGCGIAWTRTRDVQAIERILHSSECFYWMRHSGAQEKSYRDFRLQSVLEGTLNNKTYETVYNRLTVEEATVSVTDGSGLQGISMRDSDEEEG